MFLSKSGETNDVWERMLGRVDGDVTISIKQFAPLHDLMQSNTCLSIAIYLSWSSVPPRRLGRFLLRGFLKTIKTAWTSLWKCWLPDIAQRFVRMRNEEMEKTMA